MRSILLLLVLLAAFASRPALSAELRFSDGQLIEEDEKLYVEFDISWRLSWRDEKNWDAAWVFVRVPDPSGAFLLKVERDGHLMVANRDPNQPGAKIKAAEDGMGVFVYRDAEGSGRGKNRWTLRLRLAGIPPDYRGEPRQISNLPTGIEIFGLEMVYVPAGAFSVGDPQPASDAPKNAFYRTSKDGAPPFKIESESTLPLCAGEGTLCDPQSAKSDEAKGPIPDAFPKGTKPFYIGKYELLEGQYVAFLNALNRGQTRSRDNRTGIAYELFGGTIGLSGFTYTAGSPDRPAGNISWPDAAAYLDWAGLRPLTEFEWVKAARGPIEPVANEYPWGSGNIFRGDKLIRPDGSRFNLEDGNELIKGNADYSGEDVIGTYGPRRGILRADVFETRAFLRDEPNKREAAGLGYYGVSGMAGSLFDRVISATTPEAMAFAGQHGDGELAYPAVANVEGWPGLDGEGLALRGFSFFGNEDQLRLADRTFGDYSAEYRSAAMGIRVARDAPE